MNDNNVKLLAAGSPESTNAVYGNSDFNLETVRFLQEKYKFNLVDYNSVSQAAGFTESAPGSGASFAQLWYAPTADKKYFYYTAYSGSLFAPSPSSASTVLVCRRRCDGSLVWMRNTNDYNLDTSAKFSVARVAVAIHNSTLYLSEGLPGLLGPQLYAVNKRDGSLKWALAYYPPGDLDSATITRGDWSQRIPPGLYYTNHRSGDKNMIVLCEKVIVESQTRDDFSSCSSYYPCEPKEKEVVSIYCGSSSFQNTAANSGLHSPENGYFPWYTDQGQHVRVIDAGTRGIVASRISSCVSLLKEGDVVLSGGDPNKDPFLEGFDFTVIGVVSYTGSLVDAYPYTEAYSSYIPLPKQPVVSANWGDVAIARATPNIAVGPLFPQSAWTLVDYVYAIPNGSTTLTKYTKQELTDAVASGKITGYQIITGYVPADQYSVLIAQTDNNMLYYFKRINTGHVVTAEDVQGLNYWGNGIWGAPSSQDGNRIYTGTGQTHYMPFMEFAWFDTMPGNFDDSRTVLAEATQVYFANRTLENLAKVNAAKTTFLRDIQLNSSIRNKRSPRGLRSFADSVLEIEADKLNWGARTIPNDVYTFFAKDPVLMLTGLHNDADGDVSAGVQVFCRKLISAASKAGIGCVFEVRRENGVRIPVYKICQYLGPDAALGGQNYQLSRDNDKQLIVSQGNTSYFVNALPSDREYMITHDGKVLLKSFITAMDASTGVVNWISELNDFGYPEVAVVNDAVFVQDFAGTAYAISAKNGKRLNVWNPKNPSARPTGVPYAGGILAPAILEKEMIWTPPYQIPVPLSNPGALGLYGYNYDIDYCGKRRIIRNVPYSASYHSPAPGTIINITQIWETKCKQNLCKADVRLNGLKAEILYEVDECGRFCELKRFPGSDMIEVQFYRLNIFNSERYELFANIGLNTELRLLFSQ